MGHETAEREGLKEIRKYLDNSSPRDGDPALIFKKVEQLIKAHGLTQHYYESIYASFMKYDHYEPAAMFAKMYGLGEHAVEKAVIRTVEKHLAHHLIDTQCAGEMTRLAREYGLQKASLRKIHEVLLNKGWDDCAREFAELNATTFGG